MSAECKSWFDGAKGHVRLFPLPNLVFFPQVMQPLHIFEPRYRQMTADALASDRQITMVLPLPGWEQDYAGRPAIHQVATVGKIVTEQRLPDGRFNLLLRGLGRVRLKAELPSSKLYRIAEAELLHEQPIAQPNLENHWRKAIRGKVPAWFPGQAEVTQQLHKLLAGDLPLSMLADLLAFALPLDVAFKQTLLEELNVQRRLELLFDQLADKPAEPPLDSRQFPPDFSVN